jgi:hypothetical protein
VAALSKGRAMELIAFGIGILALGLAAVDELRRQRDLWQLDEELHEQSEVHSTPAKYSSEE